MQRQLVRQQNHTEKLQESAHYSSIAISQAPTSNQQFQSKQSHSSKTGQQSSKNLLKQAEQNLQKINQTSQRSSEDDNHLNLLYGKLNSETDRILKWKVSAELEIAHKEKKLKETEEVMERQRKNLFELQMHSEQLTHRLQVELKNREELKSKIDNTRRICNIVRDHCNQLTGTLNLCVEEKENLKIVYSDQIKEIEGISEKCRLMEKEFKSEIEQLEEMVTEERSQRNKVINEANALHIILNEKLEEMDKKILVEMEKSSSLDRQLLQSLEKVKALSEENTAVNTELSQSKSKFRELECQISVQRKKFEDDMTDISLQLKEEKAKLDILKEQYGEIQGKLLEMENSKNSIASQNASLTETLTNLKNLNDKNNEEITKMSENLTSVLKEKNELILEVKHLEELKTTLQAMEKDNERIAVESHSVRKELGDAHEKMLILESNIKSNEEIMLNYHKEEEKLKDQICSLKDTIEILNKKLSCAYDLEGDMKQKLQSLKEELENERNQVQYLQSKLDIKTSEIAALLDKGQSYTAMKELEIKALTDEAAQTKILNNELQDQQKAYLDQIKILEEENDSLKRSLGCEMENLKLLNNQMNIECEDKSKLNKDLEDLQTQLKNSSETIESFDSEKRAFEEKLNQLNEKLSKVSEEKSNYLKKCTEMDKEKQAIQSKSDSEIKEMVAVLEKYKRECDEIVNQKEAKISNLLLDFGETQKEKVNLEKTLNEIKKENYSYQRKIIDLEKEKDISEKTLQVKLMDLELQLTAKDKEIAEKEVALLKSDSNILPFSDKICNTPSKMKSPKIDGRKICPQTPKNNISPVHPQLTRTPGTQLGSILKEPNTPGGNKKQVTFQEDTSDTDTSSVDAMILDNADLLTRFEALERGVKIMTPIRVLPSPKNRRKTDLKKMDKHLKDVDKNAEYFIKKARMNEPEDFNEVNIKNNRDCSDFLRPKRQFKDCGRNTGLDLDKLFEMVED